MKAYGRKARVIAWLIDNEPMIALVVVASLASSLIGCLEFGL